MNRIAFGFWLANIMAGLSATSGYRSAQRSGAVPLAGEQVEGRTMKTALCKRGTYVCFDNLLLIREA
jgi:hypothetical protein